MNNLDEARQAAERGLSALRKTGETRRKPSLLIQLARVLAEKGQRARAEELWREAIAGASASNDWPVVALGLDYLGDHYRRERRFEAADEALTEAFHLRKLLRLSEVESSYRNLARLRFDQGDLRSAGVLLDQAICRLSKSKSLVAFWSVYYERGRVRERQGRTWEALADFRVALQLAREWRREVIPTDGNRVSSETGLQRIYSGLIESGNQLYRQTRDADLARETFDAAEDNRAASLRAMVALPEDPAAHAMERAQRVLDPGSALLSFHLGDCDSWLWAVTRDRFELYRLAGRQELATAIRKFETSVRTGSPDADAQGEALHAMLFGFLAPAFRDRPRWLISLDKDLFQLPFSALVVERKNGKPIYLAQIHEIQITSGAMMLRAREFDDFSGPFVGVGDAIYNTADPRWLGPRLSNRTGQPQLARLPGTRHELEECARLWSSRRVQPLLLIGRDANPTYFWKALPPHPAVIHFATHVLEEEKSGTIALSLTGAGSLESLGPGDIKPGSAGASLVVLSGCGSGRAEAPSGTGLMGLTRAWLGAGAKSILVTHWATPDDSGPFLVSFYKHLQGSRREGPAAALRQARLEMLRSGTYRARPEYWAAYFLMGNS